MASLLFSFYNPMFKAPPHFEGLNLARINNDNSNYVPFKTTFRSPKNKPSWPNQQTRANSSSVVATTPTHNPHELDKTHETPDNTEEDPRPLQNIWREIQGCNDWEGLIDPMNSHLRREIIRYGEMAQACYDSYDFDPHSKYCGTCKYQGSQFFDKLDMAHFGYQISRYLYAKSNINLPTFFQHSRLSEVWSAYANWMGYIAVTTDAEEIKRLGRRDIVIAWRGTVTYLEWIYDLKDILHPAKFGEDPSIKIQAGFLELYTKKEDLCHFCSFSAREQILAEMKRLLDLYRNEEISITITGHGLGAALAIISAYDIAEMRVKEVQYEQDRKKVPITVYSFGGLRVGNLKFKERCDELGVKVLRVVNVHDMVPSLPGIIANEKMQFQKMLEAVSFPWSYAHVGVELALDHTHSPFLKPTNDPACSHNLEAHLHLVDGYHGKDRAFRLATKRDIALVNKHCNFLKREYGVPPIGGKMRTRGWFGIARAGGWCLIDRCWRMCIHQTPHTTCPKCKGMQNQQQIKVPLVTISLSTLHDVVSTFPRMELLDDDFTCFKSLCVLMYLYSI